MTKGKKQNQTDPGPPSSGPEETVTDQQEVLIFSQKIARKVLPFLSKNSIPVTPNNYQLWYEYFSGGSPQLREVLGGMLKEGVKADPRTMEVLHRRFFSAQASQAHYQMVDQTVVRVQTMAVDIIKELLYSIAHTNRFNQNLGECINQIDEARDLMEVRDIVKGIVSEADSIISAHESFQENMEKNSRELERLKEELQRSHERADTDELTGIPNRRAFNIRLANEESRSRRYGSLLSMIMLDLDDFKHVNDVHGHLVGDSLLGMTARAITGVIRETDFAARYGGEEFAVICPETGNEQAVLVAEKLRASIERTAFTVRGVSIKVTLSSGVSTLRAGEEGIDSLIDRADQAMYLAKKMGKNRTCSENDLVEV